MITPDGKSRSCPSESELRAFLVGKMSYAAIEEVGQHLATCDQCDLLLEKLNAEPDRMVGMLRGPRPEHPLIEEASFKLLDSRAKAINIARLDQHRSKSEIPSTHDRRMDESIASNAHPTASLHSPFGLPLDTNQVELPACIGRYLVKSVLGTGGFATVYLAQDPKLDRLVAIKVLRPHLLKSGGEIKRFMSEARAAASMIHPSIVRVYDQGQQEDGSPFVVMEYIDGVPLSRLLKSEKISQTRICELLLEVAEALSAVHQKGFVHRDVKPGNILIDTQGRAHVSDFGLAMHDDDRWAHEDELAGTRPYMAPEQIRRQSYRLDGRTDVWALGVVFYEMLTSRRPFSGRTPGELFTDIERRDPKPPRQFDKQIPKELNDACLKCMAKDISQRYGSCEDLAQDVKSWLDLPASVSAKASRPSKRTAPQRARRIMISVAVGVLVLMAAAGFVYHTLNYKQPPLDVAAQVGEPYYLLKQQPTVQLWPQDASSWERLFDPEKQELQLDTDGFRLFALNETYSPNFKLNVSMSKNGTWQSQGAGLFWGYREVRDAAGNPLTMCQAVYIDYDPFRKSFLLRGSAIAFSNIRATTPDCSTRGLFEYPIDPPPTEPCALEIQVSDGQIKRILYQREPIPDELVQEYHEVPYEDGVPPLDANGRFGVVTKRGTTTFHGGSTTFTLLNE